MLMGFGCLLSGQVRKLDSLLQASANADQFSGSVLIAKNGEVVYEKMLGFADLDKREPVDTQTVFSLASVGKIITAALVMKYVEDGKLALDLPVQQYLPGTSLPNADKITIHHLLSQTSGLGNYMRDPEYPKLPRDAVDIDRVFQLVARQPLEFDAPGTTHAYSNSGFIVLGKILENVSGMPYGELLKQQLLNRFSMSHTFLTPSPGGAVKQAKGQRRMGPDQPWESTMDIFPIPLSDGGVFTTSRDLLAFDRAFYSGQIVGPAYLGKMMHIHSVGEQPGFGKIAYGYGLMVQEFENKGRAVGHNGGSPGYNAEYRHYFLENGDEYTLILLSNHDRVIRPFFFAMQEMILNQNL